MKNLLRLLFLSGIGIFLAAGQAIAQTPPAWDTLFGTAITCNGNTCAITSGPGCNVAAVPGQCSFPSENAQALCTAHGACQAVTCNAARSDCQARSSGEVQNTTPWAGFTSLRRVVDTQAAKPGWVTQMGGRIICGGEGRPPCQIKEGPACNTTSVPGQCSFPKATAHANCAAHGKCEALNCVVDRADCQARTAEEAKAWVVGPKFVSFLRVADSAPVQSASTLANPAGSSSNTTSAAGAGSSNITTSAASTSPATSSSNTSSGAAVQSNNSLGACLYDGALDVFGDLPVSLPGGVSMPNVKDSLVNAVASYDGAAWARRTVNVPQLGNVSLYVNVQNYNAAILLIDQQISVPFGSDMFLGDSTAVNKPMFVLAKGGQFDRSELPNSLKPIWQQHYGDPVKFDLQNGMTVYGVLGVDGLPGSIMRKMLGAPNGPVILPARFSRGKPDVRQLPPKETCDSFASWLKNSVKQQIVSYISGPNAALANSEKQVQLWMRPGQDFNQPMGIGGTRLAGANIDWSSTGSIAVAGNLTLNRKTLVAHYSGPYNLMVKLANVATSQDLKAIRNELSQLGLKVSTPPEFSYKDGVDFMVAVVQALPWFDLPSNFTSAVSAMSTPLGLVKLENPVLPQPQISIAETLAPADRFNIAFVGARSGSNSDPNAPLLRMAGNASMLNQKFAGLNASLSTSGLYGKANAKVGLPGTGFDVGSMDAVVEITGNKQEIGASGAIAVPGVPLNASLRLLWGTSGVGASLHGSCLPVKLNANVEYSKVADFGQLLKALSPSPNADAVEQCARDAAKAMCGATSPVPGMKSACDTAFGGIIDAGAVAVGFVSDVGKAAVGEVGKVFKAGTWKHQPARPVYNCTTTNPNAGPAAKFFVDAYPPGRLWGSRGEFDHRGMNFRRFIFSESSGKFHVITEGALGGTACGGLVGEEGVGYGRTNTSNSEIWTKALFCERGQFPEHLVDPKLIDNPTSCYAARGLSAPATSLKGQYVRANGDDSQSLYLIDANGALRLAGWKDNWSVFHACELGQYNLKENKISLHDLYKIPNAGPLANGDTCKQVLASMQIAKPPPPPTAQKFDKQFIAYCDGFKNTHVVANGRRHWISNKDTWRVFEGCRSNPNEQVNCMALADVNSVPDGGAIGDVNQCRGLRGLPALVVAAPPPPPPAPPPLAQQWRGQFVAYCDGYKNTHLIGNDGRRHWIANKDKWGVFNSCANGAPVKCVGLNEVMGIPEGAVITTAQQCNALK